MRNQFLNKKKFDLEERTIKFAEAVIDLIGKLPYSPVNKILTTQIVRSAGSIGANYCEANEAGSKKDFSYKIAICKKETKETKHWLRLLMKASPVLKIPLKSLHSEAQELLLIFSAIKRSVDRKMKVEI